MSISKNVLFVSLVCFWDIHYAAELELMKIHINKGDKVSMLVCDSGINVGCGFNLTFDKKLCRQCQLKRDLGVKMLDIDKQIRQIKLNINNIPLQNNFDCNFKNLKELKEFKFEELNIGSSVASLLISHYRDPYIEFTGQLNKTVSSIFNDLVKYYKFLDDLIKNEKVDLIYVFNGRLPFYSITLNIARINNVPIYVHERGYNINKYILTTNASIHNLNEVKSCIQNTWLTSSDYEYKELVGRKWYESRISGADKASINFTKNQDKSLSLQINDKHINVGIFLSSEDEFEAIDGWENPIYINQNDALNQIMYNSSWKEEVHFYLRVHPNLKNLINDQTKFIDKINCDRITVIPADSPISTYNLIDKMDIILVFGSTVGIEACYKKKPVILVGRSYYEDIEGIYKPENHKELCNWINNYPNSDCNLEKAYSGAIKYGWFQLNFGNSFEYFRQMDYNEVYFIGNSNRYKLKYNIRMIFFKLRKKLKSIVHRNGD